MIALLGTLAMASAPWAVDVTAGASGRVARDVLASPLAYAGGGGHLDLRASIGDAVRHEVLLGADVDRLRARPPGAAATGIGGGIGYRLLPRVGPARVGASVGTVGWRLGMDSVLNEHVTWAFGTELSVVASGEARWGAHDAVEIVGALPVVALVARPPYATTDEDLRLRSDDPLALAYSGRVGTLDAWARPSATVAWRHDVGRVDALVAADASWLRARDPEPLRAWSVGLRAGVRLPGGGR